jgi:hypothetical protein
MLSQTAVSSVAYVAVSLHREVSETYKARASGTMIVSPSLGSRPNAMRERQDIHDAIISLTVVFVTHVHKDESRMIQHICTHGHHCWTDAHDETPLHMVGCWKEENWNLEGRLSDHCIHI